LTAAVAVDVTAVHWPTQRVRRGGDERVMTSVVLSLIEGVAHL
jgi:hypothetical protein